jgi:hypothetical protein
MYCLNMVQHLLKVMRHDAHTTFHENPYVGSKILKKGNYHLRTHGRGDTVSLFLFMEHGKVAKVHA